MSLNNQINSLYNSFQSNINSIVSGGSYTNLISPINSNSTLTETNNELVISIDSSFNNRLFVDGDVILNSRLFLSKPNTLFVNGIFIVVVFIFLI